MMNKKQAWTWARNCAEEGTGPERDEYQATYELGTMEKKVWHDEIFTFGIEVGILIAVAKIFGKEEVE